MSQLSPRWVVMGILVCGVISTLAGNPALALTLPEDLLALPGDESSSEQAETTKKPAEKPSDAASPNPANDMAPPIATDGFQSLAELEKSLPSLLRKGQHTQESLRVLDKIGKMKIAAGDLEGATRTFQEALKGAEALWGKDHVALVSIHRTLGELTHASDLQAAEKHLQAIEAIGKKNFPAMMNLVKQSRHMQDKTQAKQNFRQALDFMEGYSGKRSKASIIIASSFSDYLGNHMENGEMKRILREYYPISQEVLGETDPLRAYLLEQYARACSATGDPETATTLYRQALEQAEKKSDPEHLRVVMHNFALLLEENRQLEEAEKLMLRSLEIVRKQGTGREEAIFKNVNNLGRITSKQNRHETAIGYYQEACTLAQNGTTQEYRLFAMESCTSLGQAHFVAGRLNEAESRIRHALALTEKALGGKDKPNYFITLRLLAEILKKSGNAKESSAVLAEANTLEERFKRQHSRLALTHKK